MENYRKQFPVEWEKIKVAHEYKRIYMELFLLVQRAILAPVQNL